MGKQVDGLEWEFPQVAGWLGRIFTLDGSRKECLP